MKSESIREVFASIINPNQGNKAQKETIMTAKKTTKKTAETTYADIRTATDKFFAAGRKNSPEDVGFGPDELESLLHAMEPTRYRRSAPMRKGYERSVKAIKNKKTGRWSQLAYLTKWGEYVNELNEKGYATPSVNLVPWELVPSEQKNRLRLEEKFPRFGKFVPSAMLLLQFCPEDEEVFVTPKVAILGSFRGEDGFAPKNSEGNPEQVMLIGAANVSRDRFVRGVLQMSMPPIQRKVGVEVEASKAHSAAAVPDFS